MAVKVAEREPGHCVAGDARVGTSGFEDYAEERCIDQQYSDKPEYSIHIRLTLNKRKRSVDFLSVRDKSERRP